MSELESSDLVVCINTESKQYGKLGVVFQLVYAPWVDVDFRWGGGGLYRCPRKDFTIVEKGWNTKWLAARAKGAPEHPLPVVDVVGYTHD